ncbi:MAG: cyclic nucleotide-binding domain-containing protein, partial [Alphaproteobacteria bacterium]
MVETKNSGPDQISGLSARHGARLLEYAKPFEYTAGEMLCRRGDKAERVFVLDDGRAHGGEALVAGDHYLIDVVAESAGHGVTLDRVALARIEQDDPVLALATHRWVAELLADSLCAVDDTISRSSD